MNDSKFAKKVALISILMPVFELPEENIFPHASLAEADGLLAIGGDLSPNRILNAYANGIFPWFSEGGPILWWSPDPRCVIFPNQYKPSKSVYKLIKQNYFEIRYDTNFISVIRKCATVKRNEENVTWITEEIIEAYFKLHQLGFAHSVETYKDNQLVGGLYGIAIGKVFFGESMFFEASNASKVAFYYLMQKLNELSFDIVDNQITNPHLLSLGATEISRELFLLNIQTSCNKPGKQENWQKKV